MFYLHVWTAAISREFQLIWNVQLFNFESKIETLESERFISPHRATGLHFKAELDCFWRSRNLDDWVLSSEIIHWLQNRLLHSGTSAQLFFSFLFFSFLFFSFLFFSFLATPHLVSSLISSFVYLSPLISSQLVLYGSCDLGLFLVLSYVLSLMFPSHFISCHLVSTFILPIVSFISFHLIFSHLMSPYIV